MLIPEPSDHDCTSCLLCVTVMLLSHRLCTVNALESLYPTRGSHALRRMHIDTEIMAEDDVQGNQTYHNEISLHTHPRTAAMYFCSAHMPTAWTSCGDLLTEYITQFYNRTLHRLDGVNETSPWPALSWLPKAYFPSPAEYAPTALLLRERIADSRVTVRGWREDVYNLLHFTKVEQEENSNVALEGADLDLALRGCSIDPVLARAGDSAPASSRAGTSKAEHVAEANTPASISADGAVAPATAPVRVLHMIVHQNATNGTHNDALLIAFEGLKNASVWGMDVHLVIATLDNNTDAVHSLLSNASVPRGVHVHVAGISQPPHRDGAMHDFVWAARQLLVDTAKRSAAKDQGGHHDAAEVEAEYAAWAALPYDVFSFWDVRYVADARNLRHFWELSTSGELPENWLPGFMSWVRTCHGRSAYPPAVASSQTRGSPRATSFVSRSGFPSLHKSKYCARTLDWGSLSHNDAYRVYDANGRRFLSFFNPMQGGFMATAGHMRTAQQRQCLQSSERRHWAHDSATVAYSQLYFACGFLKVVPLSCVRGFGVRRYADDNRVALAPTEDRGFMTDRLLQAWALECTNPEADLPHITPEQWVPYEADHTLYYLEEMDSEFEEEALMKNMTQTNAAIFRTPTGQSKVHEALSERTASGMPVQPPVEGQDEVGFADSGEAQRRMQSTQQDLRRRAAQRLAGTSNASADSDSLAAAAGDSPPSTPQISDEELSRKPVGGEGGPIVPPGSDFDPEDVPALQDDFDEDEEGGSDEGPADTDAPPSSGSLTEALLEELLDGIGEEEDWQNIA